MDTEQIIRDQIEIAPDGVRRYLAENRWSEVVAQIARKNNFSEDQANVLVNEVLIVLLGLDLRTNFKVNVQKSLGILEILAHDIDVEIQEKVFSEVSEWLPKEIVEDEVAERKSQNIERKELDDLRSTSSEQRSAIAEEPKWWEKVEDTEHRTQSSDRIAQNTLETASNNRRSATSDLRVLPTRGAIYNPVVKQEVEVKSQNVEQRSQRSLNAPKPTANQQYSPTSEKHIIGLNQSTSIKPVSQLAPEKEPSKSFFDRVVQTPQKTAFEEKLSRLTGEGEDEWQRRKAQAEGDKIMRSAYPSGQDPYREPLQ